MNRVNISQKRNPTGKCVSKQARNRQSFRLKVLSVYLMLSFLSNGYALPLGGNVSAGSASISNNSNRTTVTQSTQNAAINWQSFNIGQSETVQFIQPNSNSVILNRVIGYNPSSILGSMSANGKVFLVNPNGILFGKGAQVNVSGLVASTLNINDSDFMTGNYTFSGTGNGSVLNLGSISTNGDGQYVAFLGANIGNNGFISAKLGTITLAAGSVVTLDVVGDGLLNVTVNQGVMNALVQNSGLIQADGGLVLMTAQAARSLLATVVNNTGQIQAQTIQNHNGTIKMLADMQSGTVNVSGTLDASAPNGGNGGFIETSAAHLKIASNAKITTFANKGVTGTWLIDPLDFTIAATGGDIDGATLSSLLVTNSVVISTIAGSTSTVAGTPPVTNYYSATTGNGDINVNDAVTWTASSTPTTLTLNAGRDVNVNQAITATTGSLVLTAVRDINIVKNVTNPLTAITTTGGNIALNAGNNVNINSAAITTTGGNVVLMAGIQATGAGSVVFTTGTPKFTVTGPGAAVKIYNPLATITDYSGYFTLTGGATLAQYSLVFAVGLQGPTGSTGPIGLTGLTGATGATGLTGSIGPIGLTGPTGAPGTNGINGIDGSNGLIGSIGPIGLTGATGAPGTNGSNGVDGATGLTGPIGPIGLTGATGATGLTGSIGPIGLTGATGATGLAGSIGPIGLTGATGTAGTNGTNGAIGLTGATGAAGINGTNGTIGATGLTGPIGPIGPIGATGASGTNGINGTAGGPIGLTGATGQTGPIGPIGLTGATGATGPTGPMGPIGLSSAAVLYPGATSIVSTKQDYQPLTKSFTSTTAITPAAIDFELNWLPAKQLVAMTDQSYERQSSKKSISSKYNTWHGSNQSKADPKSGSSPSAKAISAALALAETDSLPAKELTKEDSSFVSLNVVGNPMDGSKFAKLKIGMTLKQVEELIGAPDWTWQQFTGAESTPYYTGTDPWLVQYRYRSEGMLTFNLSQERVLIRMLINRAG
jgi:filamentous hemagglutinin family protein